MQYRIKLPLFSWLFWPLFSTKFFKNHHLYATAYTLKRLNLYNRNKMIQTGGEEMIIVKEARDTCVKDACVKRIKALCEEKNIRPNELANRSGLTPSTLYSIFDEKRRDINISTLKILCDGFDMKLSEFFSSEEFENLNQEIE